ncbi:hypothetical protein DYB26_014961, partial [Aphanomyces astaci]
ANVQATTIGQLESQIQDLHIQIDTLQKELLAARTNQTTTANNTSFVDTTSNCAITKQEGVIADLRKQLADALAQVDVLKAERNALMELSNQLTAENRKLQLGTDSSLALKQQVEAARATSSFTDTTTTTSALDGGRPSSSRPPSTTTMSDARLKLKHAKEVLALAGKKVEDLPGGRPMRAPSLVHR